MRVSFLYFGKVPQLNGAAVFFESLINNKKKFEKHLNKEIFFYYKKNNSSISVSNNHISIKQKFYKFLKFLFNIFLPKTVLGTFIYIYMFYFRNADTVLKDVKDISDGDIVVFNDIFVGIRFLKKNANKNVKILLILHNDGDVLKMLEGDLKKIKKIKSFVEDVNNLLKSCNKIILLSSKAKVNFSTLYPSIDNSNLEIINNGVELKDCTCENTILKNKDKKIGVCIGSVSYRKGHDLLIEASNKLSENEAEKLDVYCLGNITDDDILKQRSKNIIFVNGIQHDELASYLKIADFFILCSRDEGLPLSIIEAMQFSLPVFASNVGSIPDIINENGILFTPNANDIFDVLRNICNDKYDFKAFSNKSRVLYENNFSLNKMISNYVRVIKESIDE